jgi:hypothetical protein
VDLVVYHWRGRARDQQFLVFIDGWHLVFNPGSQLAGRDLSFAQVTLSGTQSLVVTLRVDRVDGMLKARREIGTEISWRN